MKYYFKDVLFELVFQIGERVVDQKCFHPEESVVARAVAWIDSCAVELTVVVEAVAVDHADMRVTRHSLQIP